MGTQNETPIDVLLIGYENQENLGLRSILAYLLANGYKAKLWPFRPSQEAEVLEAVQAYQPRLIGFSLIFQYTLDEFGQLMRFLRAKGVKSHFTAGGHFPSLRPEDTLSLLPELDSVMRFEGELTFPELLDNLDFPQRWSQIQGLAFRQGERITLTPPRPLIENLDSLPPIFRDKQPRVTGSGIEVASVLASRGCPFDCSFCSIRQFYESAPGALRRMRSPQKVVAEMRRLHAEMGVKIFIFQDDDFPLRTPRRQWLQEFLNELDETGLAKQVRWKISCRVDDLNPQILEAMLQRGLMAVYLGVESGNEQGLRTLNKHVSVAQNLAAIELLKRYDVALAIGFMLFDPSSTISTVRENINFLRQVGEDGYFPINFCKMLPYAGTPIEEKLRETGRLKGTIVRPDYDFCEPQLDWYAFLVQRIFSQRNFSPTGLVTRLQQADFNERLALTFRKSNSSEKYNPTLRQLISRSNILALETLETLLDSVVSCGIEFLLDEQNRLVEIAEQEWRGEAKIEVELTALEQSKECVDQLQLATSAT